MMKADSVFYPEEGQTRPLKSTFADTSPTTEINCNMLFCHGSDMPIMTHNSVVAKLNTSGDNNLAAYLATT